MSRDIINSTILATDTFRQKHSSPTEQFISRR